jgi:hypothetical protein
MIRYSFDADGTLRYVFRLEEPLLALAPTGYMWAWEGCDWRLATDEEEEANRALMEEALARAPTLMKYGMFLPIVEG